MGAKSFKQVGDASPPDEERSKRKARWLSDTDPMRAKVLYHLAALGFERRHGRPARPSDLNKEFPASVAAPQAFGPWNRMSQGACLPRPAAAPQGLLMHKLQALDPAAAESFHWPMWRLASSACLTEPEVHALMLDLPAGISHQLIGAFRNGRYRRWPTNRMVEVIWMWGEKNFGGLSALIAILREAELRQDELIHEASYEAMCELLPVLEQKFQSATLADEFSKFLEKRFKTMPYIMTGAYERHPRNVLGRPLRAFEVPLDMPRSVAAETFEQEWKGAIPNEIFNGASPD